MAASTEAIAGAASALRQAIQQMPDGRTVAGPYFAQWPTIGRHRITSWVADVEQALLWAADGIEQAKRQGASAARQLEEALWRLDAADDRLVVVLSLAFGVALIKLSKSRTGVKFSPDRGLVLSKLAALGSSSAMNIETSMRQWYDHPARVLRHEVTHSLSQTKETQPLIDLDVRYTRNGAESYREARLLYPDDLNMAINDIRPEAVWQRVVDNADEALNLLIESVRASAAVIREHARLQPPALVHYDLESKIASLPT